MSLNASCITNCHLYKWFRMGGKIMSLWINDIKRNRHQMTKCERLLAEAERLCTARLTVALILGFIIGYYARGLV